MLHYKIPVMIREGQNNCYVVVWILKPGHRVKEGKVNKVEVYCETTDSF